ncbi:hypothetical protein AGMMS49944_19400 [Spirochaetia bacterium]|nr:hypothetical protein AGMMS49944_19400 [Spirochaetia bacterium]
MNNLTTPIKKELDLFDQAELNKPKKLLHKKNLKPINNLKVIFRDIRDYFAGNVTGITRDEKIAQNIMRLLFCKIFDEKNTKSNELVSMANRPNETLQEFQNRIFSVFNQVKQRYSDIFDDDEIIEIESSDLSFIVSKLEEYSIVNAERDIIADAFEELIGKMFRGGEGQFFTPRNIVQMMIDVLQPQENEKIIDPACGSGGFIANVVKYFVKNNISNHNIFGIDKDLFLSRLSKIYLTMLGENEYHIYCENSLGQPSIWKAETQQHIQLNSFDVILTNPPFGAKIPVIGQDLLSQFELGHYWTKDKAENKWLLTNNIRDKQPPQILFIERIIHLLKEGGRAGIVLPEGIFGNPSDRYIWEYIRKYASIIGIVSLSQEAFQPSTHTKTSVVFLEKKLSSRKNVFMAVAEKIGHNKNGKEIYKINNDGSYISDSHGNIIIDDDTPAIANNFSKYLKDNLEKESHLGFIVPNEDISLNIYIPEHYGPEIKEKISILKTDTKYRLVTVGELLNDNVIQIKRGNEIGSQHYGSGNIPFIRTTDIVNWEMKMDTVKAVADEVYNKYKKLQDIKENDIFFVNDGTFLIGRSSMVTFLDVKSVYQSHIKKIRVIDFNKMNPYYLFYLLNTNFVQKQIEAKTFVQATLSTLGDRLLEIILPVSTDKNEIDKISNDIKYIIENKAVLRQNALRIIDESC